MLARIADKVRLKEKLFEFKRLKDKGFEMEKEIGMTFPGVDIDSIKA